MCSLLVKLWRMLLPHICRIAAASPKWLPLCRGNSKVRQNDQYNEETIQSVSSKLGLTIYSPQYHFFMGDSKGSGQLFTFLCTYYLYMHVFYFTYVYLLHYLLTSINSSTYGNPSSSSKARWRIVLYPDSAP